MAQQYGAMQEVAELFGKGKKKEEKPASKKEDTSWHDKMVKDANESFSKSSTLKVSGAGKPQSPTKSTAKTTTRKRITKKS